jgi:hypothetical protein
MNVIIGPQMGEVVRDGKIVSTQHVVWCGRHDLKMENRFHPTPADLKRLKRTEMVRGGITDKNGDISFHYTCPLCFQTVKEDLITDIYLKRRN